MRFGKGGEKWADAGQYEKIKLQRSKIEWKDGSAVKGKAEVEIETFIYLNMIIKKLNITYILLSYFRCKITLN